MQFLTHKLANGLEIVAECNPAARSSALGFVVETGARDEADAVWGVSHFLEHMVFKGTARRTPDDVNREFDQLGADYNAYTSEEATVYYASFLPEYQQAIVALWSDLLRPALREEDFACEKQVIIEEISMYLDQPPFGAHEKCMALHFQGHPLSRSILGTTDSIRALDVEAMRGYFYQRYSPRNITVAGAGRIDFEALVAQVEQTCGQWQEFDAARPLPPGPPGGGFQALHKPSATQEYVVQLANAPDATAPDRFAAKVLATILGDDSGSRLYWELVDPGIAEQVGLSHVEFQGAGVFATFMNCDPEFTPDNLRRIEQLYRRAAVEGCTADELARAKSKINSRVVLSSERPGGRMFSVAANWTQRREYRSVREVLDQVEALTLDDLQAVLQRYPLAPATTVAVGPLENLTSAG